MKEGEKNADNTAFIDSEYVQGTSHEEASPEALIQESKLAMI